VAKHREWREKQMKFGSSNMSFETFGRFMVGILLSCWAILSGYGLSFPSNSIEGEEAVLGVIFSSLFIILVVMIAEFD
jgi:hypothetical protein